MAERCDRSFDEALLSGYLDAALTQADEQRVRVHLEDCATCRARLQEMTTLREVTMSTQFETPSNDQWSELPRTGGSRLALSLGWMVVLAYIVGLAGYAGWELATSEEPVAGKIIIFGGWLGFGLLLFGVGLDRLKAMKTDRYREVQK